MNPELKKEIRSDLSRIYDFPLRFRDRFYMPLQVRYLILWRKTAWHRRKGHFLRSKLYGLRLSAMSNRTQIDLSPDVQAGEGLYIGHLGRLIVHPDAIIGKNVNLSTGVTIGQTNRGKKKGVPRLGDSVWVGTNAVIVGNISIGNDVLIAPNAYVNFDVPDHSIVLGNPASIHPCENATESYINRKV